MTNKGKFHLITFNSKGQIQFYCIRILLNQILFEINTARDMLGLSNFWCASMTKDNLACEYTVKIINSKLW